VGGDRDDPGHRGLGQVCLQGRLGAPDQESPLAGRFAGGLKQGCGLVARVQDLLTSGGGDIKQVGTTLRDLSVARAWEFGVTGGLGQRDAIGHVDL
jgi:hypothetical protein